ncbi:hypothetical protein SDC9_164476 [bioreactor metagenome]|uniref:Uncharacterized protein n=1 Tax=bioreactor metagenome TaxID=1076179 RepID=A0A645FTQ9_9ZZZZ
MVVIDILVAEIFNKIAVSKLRMPAIDGPQIIRFTLASRFGHWVNGYAVIYPAGGIAGK